MSEFKPGDKVRIVDYPAGLWAVGRIGVVSKVTEDESHLIYVDVNPGIPDLTHCCVCFPEYVEKVEL